MIYQIEEEEEEVREGKRREIIGWKREFVGLFTADPDVHEKFLLLGEDQTIAVLCGLAPHHLVLPVLIQQHTEVVELIYTGGQPEREKERVMSNTFLSCLEDISTEISMLCY